MVVEVKLVLEAIELVVVEVRLVLKVVVGLVVEMVKLVLEVLMEVGGPRLKRAPCAPGPSRPQTVLTNVLLIRWLNYSCKNNVDISLKIAVCQILLASLGPRPLLSNSSSRAPQPTPKTQTHTHTHTYTRRHTGTHTRTRTHFLVHMFPCSLKSQASQKLLNSLRLYSI